jgi:hypothetical protein
VLRQNETLRDSGHVTSVTDAGECDDSTLYSQTHYNGHVKAGSDIKDFAFCSDKTEMRNMRFEVLTGVAMPRSAFWDVTLRILIHVQ